MWKPVVDIPDEFRCRDRVFLRSRDGDICRMVWYKGCWRSSPSTDANVRVDIEHYWHGEDRGTSLDPATANAMFAPMIASPSKYHRSIRGVNIDVYDVLAAFGVTCPATQHAVKKLLMAGHRGHKDRETDLREAGDAIARAVRGCG